MSELEKGIKDFMYSQGVEVVGIAGPDRLDGPPSLDPTYTMRGARSIVSFALPMDPGAIYDFLSKKTPITHNIDQIRTNQQINRISEKLENYITSLGHKSMRVPANSSYRRSPDVFATHPSFSHRFGAIVSGIAAQGISGNVMTKEYGASCYLGTVVTKAELKSDPIIPPRFFTDHFCKKCRICEKSCPTLMFEGDKEEYILLNGSLHPRGKRRDIDLCNGSCFGLHSLSHDKKWSSWGRHWINDWIDKLPDPEKQSIRRKILGKGGWTGDSGPRYHLIRYITRNMLPDEALSGDGLLLNFDALPRDEVEQLRIFAERIKKHTGINMKDPIPLTCGQCALVCGPSFKETTNRYKLLCGGGIIVPGKDGRLERAISFEEACDIRKKYPHRIGRMQMIKDNLYSLRLWYGYYFGLEPKSHIQHWRYKRKMKAALVESRAQSVKC